MDLICISLQSCFYTLPVFLDQDIKPDYVKNFTYFSQWLHIKLLIYCMVYITMFNSSSPNNILLPFSGKFSWGFNFRYFRDHYQLAKI